MGGIISKRDKVIAVKIFFTIYMISAFFFKPQLSFARFEFLTKALVEYGTTSIDLVEQETGVSVSDKVVSNGRSYIAATPGLAYFGLLTYWPYSRFLRPTIVQKFSLDPELELKITQYVMALSTVILFTALAVAIFFLMLRLVGISPPKSIFFSMVLYGGTPVIFYSLNITNGQNIVEMSLVLVGCFTLLLERLRGSKSFWLMLSGFCFGLALFVDISASFFLPAIVVYFLWRQWRGIWVWLLGALPGALALFVYNLISFGKDLTAYNIAYQGWVPLTSLFGSWQIFLELTLGWRVGLLFYCPLLLLLVFELFTKNKSSVPGSRLFMAATVTYTAGYSVLLQIFRVQQAGESWYFTSGGGGVRYLLPVLPLLLYLIAGMDFSLASKRTLAIALSAAAFAINIPGLFWTGGEVFVLNNLFLFMKNGFNSYTFQMIADILARAGVNLAGFSMYPAFFLMVTVIWWIWKGDELLGWILSQDSSAVAPPLRR